LLGTNRKIVPMIQSFWSSPPQEFFDKMIELHPDRINQGPLWYSAFGLLGAPTASSDVVPKPGN
jgi:hypothetical protein